MIPEDPEFHLFRLLNGGGIGQEPVPIAEIPEIVAERMGWTAKTVFLSSRDAQKIRHQPMHGMSSHLGLQLPLVIRQGDYYQTSNRGSPLQIEVVLHEIERPKRAYFLVLSRDKEDTGIFLRTFFFNSELTRNKMRDARVLRKLSSVDFFKSKP